jgi:hydrogenase-1 operon protein HyaF
MEPLSAVPGEAPEADGIDLLDPVGAAVLRELSRMLAELARDPTFSDAIDLHSLPLGEVGRAQLRRRLGQGEVDAALDIAGPSRITETAYAGAWWLRHADADDHAVLEQIVVARVPALLLAHAEDIADAAQRLAVELDPQACQEIAHE